MGIESILFEPGYMTLVKGSGAPVKHSVSSILRALDIPTGLTYTQVGAITTLANLVAVLVRTLIDKQVLDETFLEEDEYNLDDIVYSIEQMGGNYSEPDIAVNE